MRIEEFEVRGSGTYKLGKFTVLIGPNNSGKTQLLRDLQASLITGRESRKVVLSQVSIKPANPSELESVATKAAHPSRSDYLVFSSLKPDLSNGHRIEIPKKFLQEVGSPQAPQSLIDDWMRTVGEFFVAFLDGESRLKIVSTSQPKSDPSGPPQRLLQMLYEEPEVEKNLGEAFYDAFGFEVKLDYSTLAELALRVAPEFPKISGKPRDDRPIFQAIRKIDDQGDGFRAFAGILLSFLLLKDRVLLVDEPEAFLHPVQAGKLGYWMATLARKSPGQVVVATHNAHFLEGLLSVNAARIYRLSRQGNTTTLKRMSEQACEKLTSSPLLSNLRVIDALFYSRIIICEADKDRLFYRHALSLAGEDRGIAVIHAHNKQTLHRVCQLLTELAAAPAIIVDIDVFHEVADVERLLLSAGQSWDEWSKLVSATCGEIEKVIAEKAASWDGLKEKGIDILPKEVKEKVQITIAKLSKVGIFIVEAGELESWIPLSCSKRKWIGPALQALESDGLPPRLDLFVRAILRFFEP